MTFIILINVLEIILPSGDYAGLAYAFIALIIWLSDITPIFCFKYSKVIREEKLKFLFAVYNPFVIVLCHIGPFIRGAGPSTLKVIIKIAIFLFVWALFWSVLLFKPREKSCEESEQLSEKKTVTSLLLQNKTKNIIAICFTSLYMINLAIDSATWQLYSLSNFLIYTLPLFSVGLFLLFLLLKNANYLFKIWLLPMALAGELISGLFSIYSSISSMDIQLKHIPLYPVNFAFSCLKVILIAVMFIGTLFGFKYIKLLKYGALGYAILSVGLLIFNLINVGGIAYHQIDLNGTLAINTSLVIESLIRALYFIGIFILTTNKKNTDLV